MEFRLIYQGFLPPQAGRNSQVEVKQAIRRKLHPQLKEFWHQNLDRLGDPDRRASNFDEFGFRFCPLIAEPNLLKCSIGILFLRRDNPGNVVRHGGDLDNRIKVLFDGLRKPRRREEIAATSPTEEENPFYCLLEDDSLITEVHITTDRLLIPSTPNEHKHDVILIIHVSATYAVPTMEEMGSTHQLAVRTHLEMNREGR